MDVIETHAFLADLRALVLRVDGATPDAFQGYEALGVSPRDDAHKGAHAAACVVLARELRAVIDSPRCRARLALLWRQGP